MATTRILFVCLGNICRSPTAEAVLRDLLSREAPELAVEVDSAGLGSWHIGEPPDERALAAARRRGLDMSRLRARQVASEDFARFDFILAMDRTNLADLRRRAPAQYRERVRLFLEFAPDLDVDEVPDPYYGSEAGFEEVLDLAEQAARGLLSFIRQSS
ncbi:MAG TPA: low molecular weight protein-tyrosine-phosphatase [Steroidobacteraceae bacterium]|jgi:protein-tyrosine phosphatase|nr:low molecular weight protein-tyrosine-phosphatase [Steroidobacteraceae bacterium]